jgi:hypothetical protein
MPFWLLQNLLQNECFDKDHRMQQQIQSQHADNVFTRILTPPLLWPRFAHATDSPGSPTIRDEIFPALKTPRVAHCPFTNLENGKSDLNKDFRCHLPASSLANSAGFGANLVAELMLFGGFYRVKKAPTGVIVSAPLRDAVTRIPSSRPY